MEFIKLASLASILLILFLLPSLSYGIKPAGEEPSSHQPTEIDNINDIPNGKQHSSRDGKPRWSKTHLTYTFHNVPANASNPIRRCLQRWLAASNFTFHETSVFSEADVKISFENGDHGDGHPFDGHGGFVAHTFKPPSGVMHFDQEEMWSFARTHPHHRQVDLETIAMHETGHLLGLGHSVVEDAVMYAGYFVGVMKRNLHQDDIEELRSLYSLP